MAGDGVGAVANRFDRIRKLIAAHTELVGPIADLIILLEADPAGILGRAYGGIV
jgi:hypothetical protein